MRLSDHAAVRSDPCFNLSKRNDVRECWLLVRVRALTLGVLVVRAAAV